MNKNGILRQLIYGVAVSILMCANAQAESFTYSYELDDGTVVTGSFDGTAEGQFVVDVTDIVLEVNGNDVGAVNLWGYYGADIYAISFDGALNNFWFADAEAWNSTNGGNGFYGFALIGPSVTTPNSELLGNGNDLDWVNDILNGVPETIYPGNPLNDSWSLTAAEADTTFSIVVIPDTQMYVEEHPEIFEAQVNWIVSNQDAEDIIYVAHLGDLKDDLSCNNNVVNAGSGGGRTEWGVVDDTLAILDNANIAYGVVPGNHDFQPSDDDQCPSGSCTIVEETVAGEVVATMVCDDQRRLGTDDLVATQGAVTFNGVLGPWRFADPLSDGFQTTYGDPVGVGITPMINDGNRRALTNEDNFSLVEFGSVKFLIINLGYREDPNALASNETSVCDSIGNAELKWADDLLAEYPDRLGIVTSHAFMHENGIRAEDITGESNNDYNPYGQSVYSCLSENPNFLMMMSAHRPGEAWRRNARTDMQPVHALLSDYQWLDYIEATDDINVRSTFASVPTSQANFGDAGFMRIMRFDTATGLVNIETFAPAVTFEETYTYDDNPGRHSGHRHETRTNDLRSCYSPGYTLGADGLIEFTGRGLQQDSASNLCFTFRGYRGIGGEVPSVCPAPVPCSGDP